MWPTIGGHPICYSVWEWAVHKVWWDVSIKVSWEVPVLEESYSIGSYIGSYPSVESCDLLLDDVSWVVVEVEGAWPSSSSDHDSIGGGVVLGGMSASGHGLSVDESRVLAGEMPKRARRVVRELLARAQYLLLYLLGRVLVRTVVEWLVRNLSALLKTSRLRVAKLASRSESRVCRVLGRAAGRSLSLRWKKVLYIVVWVVVPWVGGMALLTLPSSLLVLWVEMVRIPESYLARVSLLVASVFEKFI